MRPTVAEIDLGALRQNVDAIAGCVGPGVGLLAMVKADAYGHGAIACARALERKVWGFGVSLVEEGIELRRAGIEAPIVVLGSFYGLAHRDLVAYRLTPVVSDESDLAPFARAAEEVQAARDPARPAARFGIHLKVDTGMARLGLPLSRLPQFLDALERTPGVELTGLATHLADADGKDAAPTEHQLARFASARDLVHVRGFRPTLTHAANSAASVRFADARFDLVRPGLAIYGQSPSSHAAYPGLTAVLRLKSRIVSLRHLGPGERVSYGGLFTASAETRIATVPIGYADGYSRRLTGQAEVLIGGRRASVIGAITMDMCMVDVTAIPCQLGDEVVLLGAQGTERITVEELARASGTIPWEIVCGISKRVPRIYLGERP